MGYLPGFATPRIVCDVPYVGQALGAPGDQVRHGCGISYWTKNYRTASRPTTRRRSRREYAYYDPIYTLPADGQEWWRDRARDEAVTPARR